MTPIEWGLLAIGSANLGLLVLIHRRIGRCADRVDGLGSDLEAMSQDFDALCRGMLHMGEQSQRIDGRIASLVDLQTRRELNGPVERDYELAEKMLACGEPLERVMSECGLVRSEAELLMRMHERRPAARTA